MKIKVARDRETSVFLTIVLKFAFEWKSFRMQAKIDEYFFPSSDNIEFKGIENHIGRVLKVPQTLDFNFQTVACVSEFENTHKQNRDCKRPIGFEAITSVRFTTRRSQTFWVHDTYVVLIVVQSA